MALSAAVCGAVVMESACLSGSLVVGWPEGSSGPSASSGVDSSTSLSVWSNLCLVGLVSVFLCGVVSIVISMGGWSLPRSTPIWG